jgi:hypothetical protein
VILIIIFTSGVREVQRDIAQLNGAMPLLFYAFVIATYSNAFMVFSRNLFFMLQQCGQELAGNRTNSTLTFIILVSLPHWANDCVIKKTLKRSCRLDEITPKKRNEIVE